MDPRTRVEGGEVEGDGKVGQGNDSITYVTLRAIEVGEELCISYGPRERLTFVDVEVEEEELEGGEGEGDSGLERVMIGMDEHDC